MAFSETPQNKTVHSESPRPVCSKSVSSRMITGLIIDTLRRHFSTPEIIINPQLQKYIWNDTEKTDILIEEATNWNPKNTQLKPALLVKRGALTQAQKLSFGDLAQGDFRGQRHYGIHWAGSHTVNCLSTLGPEAENLSEEVARELYTYAPIFRHEGNIGKFVVRSIGETTMMEESGQYWQVPIVVEYEFYEYWSLTPTGVPIRHIDIQINKKSSLDN